MVLIEPIRGQGVGTGIDLFMLMCFGGRERTVDELVHLATDCGLRFCNAAPIANGLGLPAGARDHVHYMATTLLSRDNRTVGRLRSI